MEKIKNYFNKEVILNIFAYIVIFMASLSISALLFMEGFPHGHDTEFHFANIYDAYYNLINNHYSPISANLGSGVGIGKGLFYSPLPHLTVALVGVLLKPFNVSLMTSFKLVLFLSYFISGIFMYRLGLRITNNKRSGALIASIAYIVFPYRAFDAYVRLAFAESFVFIFIPLFFLGLYNLCHDEECNAISYIEIIFGAAGLFLSHNLTAFFSYIFGFIYLLFNIKNIIIRLKNKRTWAYSLITIFITVGLVGLTLSSNIDILSNGGYNLTVSERMWTNPEEVCSRADIYYVYSGFLNINYLDYAYHMFVSKVSLHLDLILFMSFTVLFIIFSEILSYFKKTKKFHFIIPGILYFILIYIMIGRLECVIGALLFIVFYLLTDLSEAEDYKSNISLYKNPDFYYLIIMIPVAILMITKGEIWLHLPKLFCNIQFPWRLWVFVGLFLSILLALISSNLNGRIPSLFLGGAAILLLVLNGPILEERLKRIHPNPEDYKIYNKVEYVIDESWFKEGMSFGANSEYLPDIYYYGQTGYKSKYSNSLYDDINIALYYELGENPYSIDPVFLEGSGSIKINSRLAPIYNMEIECTDSGLIQMPLIFYKGYQVSILNLDTNEKEYLNAIAIDGLVAFSLDSGHYLVETNFIGTPIRRAAGVYNKIALTGLTIFIIYYLNDKNKKEIISIK